MSKRLKIYYLYTALPFVGLLLTAFFFFDAVKHTIDGNPHPQINYAIFLVTFLGGLLILREVHRANKEGRDLDAFAQALRAGKSRDELVQLTRGWTSDIAYTLRMLAATVGQPVSHQQQSAIESEQHSAQARLEGRHALPNFLSGLLVGLGLLGTFVGLLAALGDIGKMVSSFGSIDVNSADLIGVFKGMVQRMEAPMASMAIAFSASLFGLLGSIVLGFMMVSARASLKELCSLLGSEIHEHLSDSMPAGAQATSERTIERIGEVMNSAIERLTRELELSFSQVSVSLATVDHKIQGLVEGAIEKAVNRQTDAGPGGAIKEVLQALVDDHRDVMMRLESRMDDTHKLAEERVLKEREVALAQREETTQLFARNANLLEGMAGTMERMSKEMAMAQVAVRQGGEQLMAQLRGGLPVQMNQPMSVTGLDKLPEMMSKVSNAITMSASRMELVTRELADKTMNGGGGGNQTINGQVSLDGGSRELITEQVDLLRRIEEGVVNSNRVNERIVTTELEQMNRQRGEMVRVFNEHAESMSMFRSELQRIGRQMGVFHALMERGSSGLLDLLSERLSEHSGLSTKGNEHLTALQDVMTRLKNDSQQQLRVMSDLLERSRAHEPKPMVNEVLGAIRQVASLQIDLSMKLEQMQMDTVQAFKEALQFTGGAGQVGLVGHAGGTAHTLEEVAAELKVDDYSPWAVDPLAEQSSTFTR